MSLFIFYGSYRIRHDKLIYLLKILHKDHGYLSTSGFCHACLLVANRQDTQAVRLETVYQYQALGAWLTSAWLADAQRSKTLSATGRPP